MTLTKILSGVKVLEERQSQYNGNLVVKRDFAWGTYIQSDGLTQSGGVVATIWKKAFKKIDIKFRPRVGNVEKDGLNVLILGLGGGTVAKLVRKYYPEVKITGVELDPVMIELGKKYLDLDKSGVKIVIADAYGFLKKPDLRQGFGRQAKPTYPKTLKFKNSKKPKHIPISYSLKPKSFDLIFVDLYHGDKFPIKFESEYYIQRTRTVLVRGGVAVFNRLYYGNKRGDAVRFMKKLEKVFDTVEPVYPEANVIFLCKK